MYTLDLYIINIMDVPSRDKQFVVMDGGKVMHVNMHVNMHVVLKVFLI